MSRAIVTCLGITRPTLNGWGWFCAPQASNLSAETQHFVLESGEASQELDLGGAGHDAGP
jgi:hypothetical protein